MINLNKKELSYITESLLFSMGCDVCATWDKNDIENIFMLSQKIKQQSSNLKINNVYIHNPMLENGNTFFDEMTPRIITEFPEILKDNLV
jgi:hypothetical protein